MKNLTMPIIVGVCILGVSIGRSSQRVTAGEIHVATAKGDLATVQKLVAKDAKLANARSTLGETPLYLAANKGQTKVVEFLLKNKAEVEGAVEGARRFG